MQMFNNIDLEFILSVFHKILKNKRYLTFILGFFIRFLTKGNVRVRVRARVCVCQALPDALPWRIEA